MPTPARPATISVRAAYGLVVISLMANVLVARSWSISSRDCTERS